MIAFLFLWQSLLIGPISIASGAVGFAEYAGVLHPLSPMQAKLLAIVICLINMAVPQDDPFRAASGYNRIALDVMTALVSDKTHRVIVNVRNGGAISDIDDDDIVEATSEIGNNMIAPLPVGDLPEAVRGLFLATKAYEREAIAAARTDSERDLRKAMLLYPAIGEWEPSAELLKSLQWKG